VSTTDHPPVVRLTPTPTEVKAIRQYAERARRCEVASGDAADFFDQLWVRNELLRFSGERVFTAEQQRDKWVAHADKIVELARHVGIYASLAWLDRPEDALDARLAALTEGLRIPHDRTGSAHRRRCPASGLDGCAGQGAAGDGREELRDAGSVGA
jgi:hypothetical protein